MANRLRKVFIVVQDNYVFSPSNYTEVKIYRQRSMADQMCKVAQDKALVESQKMWNEGNPVPQYKVHGFYLVHEDMFRE